jgi:ribosome-associated heat shock protein Hsp15
VVAGKGTERATPPASQRLDKWLWFARFARTRSLAARLCASGAVTLGGAAVTKPNQAVRIGDGLAVPQGRLLRFVEVTGLGARRGPPAEARLLYRETAAPQPRDAGDAEWEPLLGDPE